MKMVVRYKDALNDLAFAPHEPVETALDRYYAPDLEWRSDGVVKDRAAFGAFVAGLQSQIVSGNVTVLDEFVDGHKYAQRHVYEATLTNGTTLRREIYLFGEYSEDGRFRRVNETGFDVP
ncbi:nuclear transport factor 2 family protein [Actinoplanes solisilvae]|uniref:nuclear transport factor 2 family protein n=1 Tax=Actinoplanes solisilvae TaxID=2486853 RepID=UPI000FD992CE|nr:nuclear transport factor 2 family protein [Actinoplanes solisilvae]